MQSEKRIEEPLSLSEGEIRIFSCSLHRTNANATNTECQGYNVSRNGVDPRRAFSDALSNLDQVVARLFELSDEDLKYIVSAMLMDGFLKQLRPSFEHRGLHIQPYADHSQGDRYA